MLPASLPPRGKRRRPHQKLSEVQADFGMAFVGYSSSTISSGTYLEETHPATEESMRCNDSATESPMRRDGQPSPSTSTASEATEVSMHERSPSSSSATAALIEGILDFQSAMLRAFRSLPPDTRREHATRTKSLLDGWPAERVLARMDTARLRAEWGRRCEEDREMRQWMRQIGLPCTPSFSEPLASASPLSTATPPQRPTPYSAGGTATHAYVPFGLDPTQASSATPSEPLRPLGNFDLSPASEGGSEGDLPASGFGATQLEGPYGAGATQALNEGAPLTPLTPLSARSGASRASRASSSTPTPQGGRRRAGGGRSTRVQLEGLVLVSPGSDVISPRDYISPAKPPTPAASGPPAASPSTPPPRLRTSVGSAPGSRALLHEKLEQQDDEIRRLRAALEQAVESVTTSVTTSATTSALEQAVAAPRAAPSSPTASPSPREKPVPPPSPPPSRPSRPSQTKQAHPARSPLADAQNLHRPGAGGAGGAAGGAFSRPSQPPPSLLPQGSPAEPNRRMQLPPSHRAERQPAARDRISPAAVGTPDSSRPPGRPTPTPTPAPPCDPVAATPDARGTQACAERCTAGTHGLGTTTLQLTRRALRWQATSLNLP